MGPFMANVRQRSDMWKKVIYGFLVVTGALSLSSCERVWNAVNRSALEEDVRSLLTTRAIEQNVPVTCSMVGATRDGVCGLEMAWSEIAFVVEQLNLVVLDPADPQHLAYLNQLQGSSTSCLQPDDDAESSKAWVALGRPPELRLESGAAFEFLLVIYRQSESRACFLMSYAYG